jgi:aminoglycoside phosphotransferase (APT) family kinase protein
MAVDSNVSGPLEDRLRFVASQENGNIYRKLIAEAADALAAERALADDLADILRRLHAVDTRHNRDEAEAALARYQEARARR